jgi:hypothetical protein
MAKDPSQLFEDGFVTVMLAVYKLRKEGKHQEAYDGIGNIIKLLMQERQDIRKTAKIDV